MNYTTLYHPRYMTRLQVKATQQDRLSPQWLSPSPLCLHTPRYHALHFSCVGHIVSGCATILRDSSLPLKFSCLMSMMWVAFSKMIVLLPMNLMNNGCKSFHIYEESPKMRPRPPSPYSPVTCPLFSGSTSSLSCNGVQRPLYRVHGYPCSRDRTSCRTFL